jgi:hypothetical protein
MVHLGPEHGEEFRIVTDEQGRELGYFSLATPEAGNVYLSQVVVYEPNKGTGAAIYRGVGQEVSEKGLTLISDPDSFSYAAFRLWLSLERCGDAVRLDDGSTTHVDDRGDVYDAAFRLSVPRMPSND